MFSMYTWDLSICACGNINIKQTVLEVLSDYSNYQRMSLYFRYFFDGSRVLFFVFRRPTRGSNSSRKGSLRSQSVPAQCMHGDKTQQERGQTVAEFRSGASPMFVVTDVAARGLDVNDGRILVNVDMPTNIEDYVRRIGRTGRAAVKREDVAFLTDKTAKMAPESIEILGEKTILEAKFS